MPVVLGFRPDDSIVLVTSGAEHRPFHARIDLPDDPADLGVVAEHLARAAHANGAEGALVVVYTHDTALALEAARVLRAVLHRHGIGVPLALRADGDHYADLDDPTSAVRPYDLTAHPITAEAVYDGRLMHTSRQGLVDSLVSGDPDAVEQVYVATRDAQAALLARESDPPGFLEQCVEREALAMLDVVRQAIREDRRLAAPDLARLLAVLTFDGAGDRFWDDLGRLGARKHVAFWTDVVRRSHVDHVDHPAALLAFAAWMHGDGALAWCAIDRCREKDPDNALAALVATALLNAVPPEVWESAGSPHLPTG